jgi:hypothetical protein
VFSGLLLGRTMAIFETAMMLLTACTEGRGNLIPYDNGWRCRSRGAIRLHRFQRRWEGLRILSVVRPFRRTDGEHRLRQGIT